MGESCLLNADRSPWSRLRNGSKYLLMLSVVTSVLVFGVAHGQNGGVQIEQVRWKSESDVRELMGEPETVHGPIGTHANYVLWKYADVTVAFANGRVFHLFDKDSLKKFELDENR